ncbi:phosphate ABC transporter substrate-binding protein [Trinickia terrae]|uniref:Phosphate ABC transporter substrate-binding protein n=1 Tax=Trinickia terrae TaxID=2571161 RepID=A0A4U1I463_9BURK|nr:phosphate ABC transporter substrate-binding protein [Trinickia terrae]
MKRIIRPVLLASLLWTCAAACHAQLVVIVSAKNPLASLGESDVADLYLGRTSQLPGGAQAVPIDQAEDDAQRIDFYRLVTGKSQAQLRAYWSKLIFTGRGTPPRSVADAQAVKKLVSGSPNAIGYIDKSELDSTVKAVLTLH